MWVEGGKMKTNTKTQTAKMLFATLLAVITVLFALSFTSCGKTESEKGAGTGDGAGETVKVELGKAISAAGYKIVRNDDSSDAIKSIASGMYKELRKATDDVKIGTDYNGASAHEILLGNTTRKGYENVCDGLNYDDWYITSDKNNIVIAGGSDEAVQEAVNYFLENFFDAENATFSLPKTEYRHITPVTFKSLTVDGVDISEFKLLNKSYNTDVDSFLSVVVKNVIGKSIAVADPEFSAVGDGGHYIVLDGSGLIEDEYSITVENGNIVLKGSSNSLEKAKETFLGDFTKGLGSDVYNLTSADNKTYSTGKKTIPYTKDMLMQVLTDVSDSMQIIIGEQIERDTKQPTKFDDCVNRFVDATGTYPSIMGIDLACYGIDLMEYDEAWWSSFLCDIVDYCAGGGIVTASAHFANPSGNTPGDRCRGLLGYDDSMEGYEQAFEDLLTEGTEYNKLWKEELTTDARFLKALGDNGVTVIWRPLHEMNGDWFWFCTTQHGYTLDSSYLKRMWIYMYDYYVNELGLTNLIWHFGPNTSTNVNDTPGIAMSPWYCYPGDEYVDMVGVDWYTSGEMEILKNDNYRTLLDKTGKIGSISEFGPGGTLLEDKSKSLSKQEELFNSMDLYNTLFELKRTEELNIAYLLTWAGRYSIPSLGKGKELMETDFALDRADVKAMFDKLAQK